MSRFKHNPISTVYQNMLFAMNNVLISAAEVANYEGWDNDYCVKNIKDSIFNTGMCNFSFKFTIEDFQSLSVDELYQCGFRMWEGNTRMIPLWIKQFIHENETVTCINGSKMSIKDLDNDHRAGCIACFFTMSEELEVKTISA